MSGELLPRSFVALRGLIYAAAFVWLWVWVALSVRRFDVRIPLRIPAWLMPIGLAIASAGALVAALCLAAFVTHGRGTPAPFDPPREFIATGPYRYVRNPMYLGAAAVILGAGLAVSSPSILWLAAAFLTLMHLVTILYEEPNLAGRFGDSYAQYKFRVRRWLPRRPVRGAAKDAAK